MKTSNSILKAISVIWFFGAGIAICSEPTPAVSLSTLDASTAESKEVIVINKSKYTLILVHGDDFERCGGWLPSQLCFASKMAWWGSQPKITLKAGESTKLVFENIAKAKTIGAYRVSLKGTIASVQAVVKGARECLANPMVSIGQLFGGALWGTEFALKENWGTLWLHKIKINELKSVTYIDSENKVTIAATLNMSPSATAMPEVVMEEAAVAPVVADGVDVSGGSGACSSDE